jgi:cytochrome c peroxidase
MDGTVDFAQVRKDIEAAMDADAEQREGTDGMGGTLVRLAWHASGTYAKADNSGGSNGGRIRYSPEKNWGANAGLDTARNFLEPIKAKYPNLSYADLYTLAGVVAIEYMGGPSIEWHSGREDFKDGSSSPPDGRLPNADMGVEKDTIQHIRDIFGRMGFNDREIVALIGAHGVGRCHENASGYWGPWTNAETTFSNEFFVRLVKEDWTVKENHEGKKWEGPMQYENEDTSLMMLPADVALTRDREFNRWVHMYAEDE